MENISFILTTNCNLRCSYCYYRDSDAYSSFEYITVEQIVKVVKSYYLTNRKKVGSITLTGGEPFLYENLATLIESISDYCNKIIILTNGTLISRRKELIDVLDKYNVIINISLDSLERVIGRGEIDMCLDGINYLDSIQYKNYSICPTVTKENLQDIIEIVKYCKENNKNVLLGFVDLPKENSNSLMNLDINGISSLKELINNCTDLISSIVVSAFFKEYFSSNSRLLSVKRCDMAANGMVIDVDGNIYLCYHNRIKIGNLQVLDTQDFSLLSDNHNKICSEISCYSCVSPACFRVKIN